MGSLLPPAFSREGQVVALCAKSDVDALAGSRIRKLAQVDIDWAAVAQMAKWHGVVPLVYQALARYCAELVPAAVLADLKQYFHAGALLSHSLVKDLAELCHACERAGVTVVPFKGLALGATAYGSLAARECGDLDIMVRRGDIPRVRATLLELGYENAIGDVPPDTHGEPFHVFTKRSRAATVDLQWVMADGTFSFPLDREPFWRRLQTVQIGGHALQVLSPEDLLVVLCAHGGKHLFEQLKWICDIAELIRSHPTLDWAYVEDCARQSGCWRMVMVGIGLARTVFGAHVPQELLDAIIQDPVVSGLIRRMPKSLLLNPDYGLGEEDTEAFLFATKDSTRARIRHGLLLCRNRSASLAAEYPWLPSWKLVQAAHTVLEPARHVARRMLPSHGLRRRVAGWLLPAS